MKLFYSRLAVLLTAAAVVAVPAAAWAGKKNDTLTYVSDSEPENISPYHNNLREGVIIGRHVFDNLIYRDPATGKYGPQLATEWSWVDDTTLDLTIRKGVVFHNGDPLTADDVVWTLNYVVSPDLEGHHQAERRLDQERREDRRRSRPHPSGRPVSGGHRISRRPGGDLSEGLFREGWH
nr:ABC transporter substrate-binding protein [Rhodopseudomonas sp. P2A-2r]